MAAQALVLAIMIGGAAIALTSVLSPGLARPEESKRSPVVLPPRKSHTDHSGMMKGPFTCGPSVTRACLGCHPAAGQQMLHSAHFTWLGEAGKVPGAGGPGHDLPQRVGKRNLINNFCLSIESNWPRCTNCHAGYRIDPSGVVAVSKPRGSIRDPKARIWPFKIHRGKQPFDEKNQYLLVAQTYGPGGFWSEFNWDKALQLGAQASGLPYSGQYGFAATEMYWPLAHMVQPGARALQCGDCHGEHGRMDWTALGYESDPAYRGGRARLGMVSQ